MAGRGDPVRISGFARLRYDPLPPLLEPSRPALRYFTRRDVLDEAVEPVESLWDLPEPRALFRRQLPDGAWKYPGVDLKRSAHEDYGQLETYRNLAILVEKYGLDCRHAGIQRAAEVLFGKQTAAGDFRGIYGNQYSPNYTGQILELLVKAGFAGDPRAERAFNWLLSIRQEDGGWAIPLRTRKAKFDLATLGAATIEPDRSQPASHLITGCVLRAFAAHPLYRSSEAARRAGELLAGRLFLADTYPDRREPSYWMGFSYPFWQTDLLSALDTLAKLGFDAGHPQIAKALGWFVDQQQPDGGWRLKLLRGKDKDMPLWIGLAVCRMMKAYP